MSQTFSLDISAWVGKTKANADALVRQIVQEMAFRVVETTPVATGFARASWWASINEPGMHPAPPVKGQQSGADAAATAEAMTSAIMAGHAGDVFYVLNNCAYIEPLEYGHSKQAPNGMVRPVVAAAPHIVEQVAAQLASGKAPPEGQAP
jgi:hypothetical protein